MQNGNGDKTVTADRQPAVAFEQLLDEYSYTPPKAGQMMAGEVLRVDSDAVLVDVGLKRDAIVPREDLKRLDQEKYGNLEPGEQVPICIVRAYSAGGDLLASISRGLEFEDWERAAEALASAEAVELEVVGHNRGGLVVQFGRLRGFVPNSHMPSYRRGVGAAELQALKQDHIGQNILLKVIEVEHSRRRLVLSARRARAEARQRRLNELEVGQVVRGRVVNLVDFGAFVDLGEIDGLIHVSELAWGRVEHPSDVLTVGDEVEAQVKKVDIDRERVGLSRKALLPNPWESITEQFSTGDVVEGVVVSVTPYGAFVALPNGVEGLIHVSEMDIVGPGGPQDVVQSGEKVVTRIIEIDPEQERVSLSLQNVTKEEPAPVSPA